MGKTRELFNKIRDTKGTFHAKMGTIKERNGMDLTDEDENKKRWQLSFKQKKNKLKRRRRSGMSTQTRYTKKIFMFQITM